MAVTDKQALWDYISKKFANEVLHTDSIIPESNEYYVVSLLFGVYEAMLYDVQEILRNQNIATACCENVKQIGLNHGLTLRNKVRPSVILKLTGKCGAALADKLSFKINDITLHSVLVPRNRVDNLPKLSSKGEAYVFAELDSYTNDNPEIQIGNKGVLLEHLANISPVVEVVSHLCGPIPEESCEQLRSRLLYLQKYKLRSAEDLLKDATWDFPCLANLRIIENAKCCSFYDASVDPSDNCMIVIPNFDSVFEHSEIPDELLFSLESYLFGNPNGSGLGKMPVGICGRVIKSTKANLEISIVFNEDIPYKSQLDKISSVIKDYILGLPSGSSVSTFDIQRLFLDVVGSDYKDICVQFSQDKKILTIDNGLVTSSCDVSMIPDVKIFDTEGNIIG